MQPFINIRALIIDMDGVLWHGNHALPGLVNFFKELKNQQIPFILATNNSSLTQEQYKAKLEKMGVSVTRNEVLTSSMATALHLSEQTDPQLTKLFIIGEEGLRQPFIDQGYTLINTDQLSDYEPEKTGVDFVVCGLDRKLSWEKLAIATLYIRAGAKFIATNADTTLPMELGIVPGNGSTLAALQAATQVNPIVIGKPKPIMYQQAIKFLGVASEYTIAIGDRLDTDILGAVNTGIRSVMVLTGISTEEDLKSIEYQPTWIMSDIQAITVHLKSDLDNSIY